MVSVSRVVSNLWGSIRSGGLSRTAINTSAPTTTVAGPAAALATQPIEPLKPLLTGPEAQ
jgi:hypothetical protein